jgi:uncharacterized protein (TIGR02646 family)
MIYVDRARVTLPDDVAKKLDEERQALAKLRELMDKGAKALQQSMFRFRAADLVFPHLRHLFEDKCAYCESAFIAGQSGELDHFRPSGAIQELDGTVLRDGYWWLAHDWRNLYLACVNCSRLHKRNQFPVDGTRAVPFARGQDLLAEKALLLDPCLDQPSEFLHFESDGSVRAQRAVSFSILTEDKMRRAQITIDVVGLNRPSLVDERRKTLLALNAVAQSVARGGLAPDQFVQKFFGAGRPYLAACIQAVRSLPISVLSRLEPHFEGIGRGALLHARMPAPVRGKRVESRTRRRPAATPPAPPVPQAPEALAAQPVFIKHVSFRNFKGLRELDLDLPVVAPSDPFERASEDARPISSRAGWFVLLGENAVGKSSILEGIALASMGADNLRKLVDAGRVRLDKLVHVPVGASQSKSRAACTIRLTLVPEQHGDVELRITPKSFEFLQGGSVLPTLLRGYGFVRLPPRPDDDIDSSVRLDRFDNLFDPRQPLCDVDRWMTSLPYDAKARSSFDYAAQTILTLLPDARRGEDDPAAADGPQLRPVGKKVVVRLGEREFGLEQLSSGYQSVIALAADIISGIPSGRLFDMREACGIVLLDEIGTQLHPRWRMQAIDDLRRAFPGMQFIATTHEPLCLKGVGKGEVAVLRRQGPGEDVTAIIDDLPDPRAMRVDQLLTSPLFGLDSTIDPDVDQLFQRYFRLLAKRDGATAREQSERERLKLLLTPHRGLGYTRSDQLVYELLDQFLASETTHTRAQSDAARKSVRQQVFDIWRNAAARHRGQA